MNLIQSNAVKVKKIDLILFSLLLILLFLFWWPTRNLPFWWDSAGVVAIGSKILIRNNFKLIELGIPGNYPHTILFVQIHALLWKVFGTSILVSHLLMLFFGALTLLYMYLLGKLLFKNKPAAGFIGFFSGVLLLFTPVFYAQLGIIYTEIPIAAFALMSVYYLLQGKIIKFTLSNLLLVFTKDTAIFIVVIEWLYVIAREIISAISVDKPFRHKAVAKKSFPFLLVIFLLFLFFLVHKLTTGWWYIPPGYPQSAISRAIFPENIWNVFRFMFIDQWRIIPTILLLIFLEEGVVRRQFQKEVLRPDVVLIFILPLLTAVFFGLTEFLQRYIVIALPLYYVLFMYLFVVFLQKRSFVTHVLFLTIVTGIICGFFYTQWNLHRQITTFYFTPLEDNLEYRDVIAVGEVLSDFLQKHYPEAKILTSFPANYMIEQPFQGYVKKPLRAKDCDKIKVGDKFDFVIFHPYSPASIACYKLIQLQKLHPYRNFERNGKFMSIYR